jgi:FixJ family two-component response regulator
MNGEPAIVFVVDDNRSVREGVTSLLASVGLRAETFRTAEEFLRACPSPKSQPTRLTERPMLA